MSSPRVQKIFEAMPNQITRLGKYTINFRDAILWQGRVATNTDGWLNHDAVVLDFTGATWATLNKRVILVAEPASDLNKTAAMKTQSHASGHFIDGSVRFHAYMEAAPEFFGASDNAKALARFQAIVQQHLLGQLAAPMQWHFCDATVQPALDGVAGAVASATFQAMDFLLPYGMVYPGGV